MDLARCVDALERRSNFVYQWNFVRNLKARMRRKAAAFPGGVLARRRCGRVWTVRAFDEAYTAPHHGFRDAADYYHRASALRVIDRIRDSGADHHRRGRSVRPGTTPFRGPEVTGNPNITVVITPHGGHCAYLERAAAEYDGYWAEREILRFAQSYVRIDLESRRRCRSSIARPETPS